MATGYVQEIFRVEGNTASKFVSILSEESKVWDVQFSVIEVA